MIPERLEDKVLFSSPPCSPFPVVVRFVSCSFGARSQAGEILVIQMFLQIFDDHRSQNIFQTTGRLFKFGISYAPASQLHERQLDEETDQTIIRLFL